MSELIPELTKTNFSRQKKNHDNILELRESRSMPNVFKNIIYMIIFLIQKTDIFSPLYHRELFVVWNDEKSV